jgi:AcrR family transcriptional regulator
MLVAALAMVSSTGLTVSLEHISFEDVIRDAGVSRSAVYRRWPYKGLFFSDLLRQLATAAGAGVLRRTPRRRSWSGASRWSTWTGSRRRSGATS